MTTATAHPTSSYHEATAHAFAERIGTVLDAGCGRGLAWIALAERFPNSRFVGYDLCKNSIAYATDCANNAGLSNIRFELRDLTGYAERNAFDFIASFDAVHDQKDPESLIRALYGALRPGGVYRMQDIGGSARLEENLEFPMAPLLYAISCVHCTPASLGQGGAGLGRMWGWETAQHRPGLCSAPSDDPPPTPPQEERGNAR